MFPRDLSDTELMHLDWPQHKQSRHLVLTTHGYGNAGAFEKTANFSHKLLLESGSFAHFDQLRSEAKCFTPDQGVESSIADGTCRIAQQSDIARSDRMVG